MRDGLTPIRSPKSLLPRFAARMSLRRITLLVACLLAPAAVALACGWFGPSESVRFGGWGGSDERAFSRLPPISLGGERLGERSSLDEEEAWESYEARERRAKKLDELCAKSADPEAAGDREGIERARAGLRACLKGSDDQQRRNTARDLLDAFAAIDHGSQPTPIQSYVKARRLYDSWLSDGPRGEIFANPPAPTPMPRTEGKVGAEGSATAESVRRALDVVAADRNLADNADYLRAAVLYREVKYEEAGRAFESLAVRHPRSEKRDAALLMAGLAHTKRSSSYVPGDLTATASDPCVNCRDEAWRAARTAVSRLLGDYPRGRFSLEARGHLAYLSLRVGDAGAGLAEYYRMLADEADEAARAEALVSLRLARRRMDAAAMRSVEAELADEPRAALVYAYHRIYNYAQSFGTYDLPPALEEDDDNSPDYGKPGYEARERERQKKLDGFTNAELRRVADFAAAMMRRYPRTEAGAEFTLRLAQANFELDEPRPAREFAARALAAGLRGEKRAEGLWIRGVSEYRLKDFNSARRTLLTLVAENPKGRLEPGARRLVAMIAEDAGDLDAALEQYLALDYTEDAAYFVDVLMTPQQLAAFIERRPDHQKIDELNYALGVRHLRDGRFDEARAGYARVRTRREEDYYWRGDGNCAAREPASDDYNPRCVGAKDTANDEGAGVLSRWVLRDLQTINDLEAFDRAFAAAPDDEARTEALYQKASYLYQSDLLFYNPAAWRGMRHWLLPDIDSNHGYRAAGEPQQLFAYAQRHEMAARALDLYLETFRRFPRTRAARDALYTAAVCHNRLSNYNNYWRGKYAAGLHAGDRMVRFADVRAAYPDYRFPVGSDYGWQPATRTIYGKPAWPAPPKPRPKLTAAQRVKRLALARWPALSASVSYAAARVWHWLMVALVLAACLLAERVASRSRRQWRAHLARRGTKYKPVTESLRYWLREVSAPLQGEAKTVDASVEQSTAPAAPPAPLPLYEPNQTWIEMRAHEVFHRAELISRATARALWHYVSPLTHDARGRQTLLTNAAAHAALFALLLALVRMIYAG